MRLDKRLLVEVGGTGRYMGQVGGLALLWAGLTVGQAFCLALVISGVFLQHQTLTQLGAPLVALLLVITGRAGVGGLSELVAGRLAGRVKTRLRRRVFAHLLRLGPSYTKGERSGELSNTLTEGIETLDPYLAGYLPQVVVTTLVPVVVLLAVGLTDWLSGLVLLLTAPLLPLFLALVGWLAEAQAKKQWHSLSLMSAHFLDVLQGLSTLKMFGRSQAQVAVIGRISDNFRQSTMQVLRVAFLSALVMELGATLSTAIIAVEIGLRLLYNQIEFGPTLFVLLLAPEFYLPLRTLGVKYHAGQAGAAAVERIFEILETPLSTKSASRVSHEPLSQETAWRQDIRRDGLRISFENVSYNYPQDETNVLQNISFQIEPGQQVALVGPSGSGKSTLAALLLRFIEPANGEIGINGRPLTDWEVESWRELVAWVPQRPYLFNMSVSENIELARRGATPVEIEWASRQAQAHEFIEKLPQGYATLIGERGCRLSGGQAQRISLARAFLKDAPVLILDEATAHLDEATEAGVGAAIERLRSGRTVLTIAHQLSAIEKADQVLTLKKGQLVTRLQPIAEVLSRRGSAG